MTAIVSNPFAALTNTLPTGFASPAPTLKEPSHSVKHGAMVTSVLTQGKSPLSSTDSEIDALNADIDNTQLNPTTAAQPPLTYAQRERGLALAAMSENTFSMAQVFSFLTQLLTMFADLRAKNNLIQQKSNQLNVEAIADKANDQAAAAKSAFIAGLLAGIAGVAGGMLALGFGVMSGRATNDSKAFMIQPDAPETATLNNQQFDELNEPVLHGTTGEEENLSFADVQNNYIIETDDQVALEPQDEVFKPHSEQMQAQASQPSAAPTTSAKKLAAGISQDDSLNALNGANPPQTSNGVLEQDIELDVIKSPKATENATESVLDTQEKIQSSIETGATTSSDTETPDMSTVSLEKAASLDDPDAPDAPSPTDTAKAEAAAKKQAEMNKQHFEMHLNQAGAWSEKGRALSTLSDGLSNFVAAFFKKASDAQTAAATTQDSLVAQDQANKDMANQMYQQFDSAAATIIDGEKQLVQSMNAAAQQVRFS